MLCEFERLIYPSFPSPDSYMVALYRPCERIKDRAGNVLDRVKAVGYCLPMAANLRFEMQGRWSSSAKHGLQFEMERYEEVLVPTKEGVIAYLSSGQIKGIGPKMAERLYDAFAWFRLKYPEGRIAVQASPGKDCFVATARVYPSYKDPADCFLAEATASRGYCEDKPSVSPREWAQTAAIGVALRNAGFGLQFAIVGDDFPENAPESLPESPAPEEYTVEEPAPKELTPEEKLKQAMDVACPITKFKGKTLGEVLQLDPGAIKWVAEKFTGSEEIKSAAQFIRDCAIVNALENQNDFQAGSIAAGSKEETLLNRVNY